VNSQEESNNNNEQKERTRNVIMLSWVTNWSRCTHRRLRTEEEKYDSVVMGYELVTVHSQEVKNRRRGREI
jgi:hypothetical protein